MNVNFREVLNKFNSPPDLSNTTHLTKLKKELENQGVDSNIANQFITEIERPSTNRILDSKNNPFKKEYQDKGIVKKDIVENKFDYNVLRENPGDFISDYDISDYDIDLLMKAIEMHEHRDARNVEGYSPWIRTKKEDSGSSAYGPGQLTKKLLGAFTEPGERRFYDVENLNKEMYEKFFAHQEKALKYGGVDMIPGMEHMDYGGPGEWLETDRPGYMNIFRKLVEGKLRANVDKDDPLFSAMKSYGTGTDHYATQVKKHYDALLRAEKKTYGPRISKLKNVESKVEFDPADLNPKPIAIPNMRGGGVVEYQEKGEVGDPKHLQKFDLSKAQQWHLKNIQSPGFRTRLFEEHKASSGVELTDEELDKMISDATNTLTVGAGEGKTGFYTKYLPGEHYKNTLGFMDPNFRRMTEEGVLDPNVPWTKENYGNIYKSLDVDKGLFSTTRQGLFNPSLSNWSQDVTQGETTNIHEMGHRLTTPTGLYRDRPMNEPYLQSFFGNAPQGSVYDPNNPESSYYLGGHEIKTGKWQLEHALEKSNIYDPSKGGFSMENIDKMLSSGFELDPGTGYLLNKGLGYDQLTEAQKAIKDQEDVINPYTGSTGTPYSDEYSFGPMSEEAYAKLVGDPNVRKSPEFYEALQKRIDRQPYGNKRWREHMDEYGKRRSKMRYPSYQLEDAIEAGHSDDPELIRLLEQSGIQPVFGDDGFYDDATQAKLEELYKNQETTYDEKYKELREFDKDRPKEEGLFGAFGPFGNLKTKKAERKATKQFNKHYGTDHKNWDEVREHSEQSSTMPFSHDRYWTNMESSISGIDQDLENITEGLKSKGGHKNTRDWRKLGTGDYAFEIDKYNQMKIDDLLHPYSGGEGYWDDPEAKARWEQSKKTGQESGFPTSESGLFNQALDEMAPKYREALEWYTNRNEDGTVMEFIAGDFDTRKKTVDARSKLKLVKHAMHNIKTSLKQSRSKSQKFIGKKGREFDYQKQQELLKR